MKRCILCLAVLFLYAVSGTSQSTRRLPSSNTRQNIVTDIRQVDFKNFTHKTSPEVRRGTPSARLRNGEYEERENGMVVYTCSLNDDGVPITYGDVTGDGRDEAIVILAESTGGNGVWQHGITYTIKDRQVSELMNFENGHTKCDEDGDDCSIQNIRVENGLLIIDRAVQVAGSAFCCYRPTKYRWNGGRLVEVGKLPVKRKP